MDGGRKLYFKRDEIDRVLASNAVQENGRIDATALEEGMRPQADTNGHKRT
jgi:hypothetical protein